MIKCNEDDEHYVHKDECSLEKVIGMEQNKLTFLL